MSERIVDEPRPSFVAVVHTFIWDHQRQEFVLLERANTGTFDGRHSLPGGHVQPTESVTAAAIREVREEIGVEIEAIAPSCVLPFLGGVNYIFSSSKWTGTVKNGEPDKCASVGWFARNRLPNTVVPWLTKALELHDSDAWFHDFSKR